MSESKKKDSKSQNSALVIHSKSVLDDEYGKLRKLVDACAENVVIHGLESGIPLAIALALKLQELSPQRFEISVRTSSVDLEGPLETLCYEIEPAGWKHTCAAIHIIVTPLRTVLGNTPL